MKYMYPIKWHEFFQDHEALQSAPHLSFDVNCVPGKIRVTDDFFQIEHVRVHALEDLRFLYFFLAGPRIDLACAYSLSRQALSRAQD